MSCKMESLFWDSSQSSSFWSEVRGTELAGISSFLREIGRNIVSVVCVAKRKLRNKIIGMGWTRERENERAVAGRDVAKTRDKRVHYVTVDRGLGNGSGESRNSPRVPGCDWKVRKESRKNCWKETAADRFVKPPSEKENSMCVSIYTSPLRVFLLDISTTTAASSKSSSTC